MTNSPTPLPSCRRSRVSLSAPIPALKPTRRREGVGSDLRGCSTWHCARAKPQYPPSAVSRRSPPPPSAARRRGLRAARCWSQTGPAWSQGSASVGPSSVALAAKLDHTVISRRDPESSYFPLFGPLPGTVAWALTAPCSRPRGLAMRADRAGLGALYELERLGASAQTLCWPATASTRSHVPPSQPKSHCP